MYASPFGLRRASSLYRISDDVPSEADKEAADVLLRDYVRDLDYGSGRYLRPEEIRSLPDADLSALLSAARVLLRAERASRATSLYLRVVREIPIYPSSRTDYRNARRLLRAFRTEAERRVGAYRAAASRLARDLRG